MEKRKTPRIRFKGFSDDWEQRKLNNLVNEVIRTDETSNAPVMMITANDGFINQSERYSVNNAGQSLKKYILLQKGELAYNHGASKLRPYGSCFALSTEENARIPFVYHCFSTETENSEFLSIVLNGKVVEGQLRKIVSSGARMDGLLNISFEEYASVSMMLPKRAEQDQITSCFHKISHLITLHQRKLEKLKIIKKSMLEKLFPKNGEKMPKIRFSGFTDDWEQRKFGDLFKRRMERNNGQFDKTKWISVANMYYQNPDKVISNNIDTRTYVLRLGDISFEGHTNNEFKIGRFVGNDIGDGVISELFPIYQHITPYDLYFWKYYINMENIMFPKLLRCIAVSYTSSNKLDEKIFLEETILEPSLLEQKKIGTYFKQLDRLITLHQSKLEKLTKIKKSMLERMFV